MPLESGSLFERAEFPTGATLLDSMSRGESSHLLVAGTALTFTNNDAHGPGECLRLMQSRNEYNPVLPVCFRYFVFDLKCSLSLRAVAAESLR
jgi:hypothetical protein